MPVSPSLTIHKYVAFRRGRSLTQKRRPIKNCLFFPPTKMLQEEGVGGLKFWNFMRTLHMLIVRWVKNLEIWGLFSWRKRNNNKWNLLLTSLVLISNFRHSILGISKMFWRIVPILSTPNLLNLHRYNYHMYSTYFVDGSFYLFFLSKRINFNKIRSCKFSCL